MKRVERDIEAVEDEHERTLAAALVRTSEAASDALRLTEQQLMKQRIQQLKDQQPMQQAYVALDRELEAQRRQEQLDELDKRESRKASSENVAARAEGPAENTLLFHPDTMLPTVRSHENGWAPTMIHAQRAMTTRGAKAKDFDRARMCPQTEHASNLKTQGVLAAGIAC